METQPLALITGGTSGIGFAIAQKLAPNHDLALVFAENAERAENSLKKLRADFSKSNIQIFQKHLGTESDVDQLFKDISSAFGRQPLVLVNAAGRLRDQLFMGSNFSDHQALVQEHLIMSMALCHVCLKSMSSVKFGRILNISSISAHFAKRGQANYAAAKAGIEGFTRTLALEVAHRGITVNAIAPGLIETPMTENIIKKMTESGIDIRKRIPAGRCGKPEEVGDLAAFLCSPQAAYITGAVITIDGGRSLGDPAS